MVWYGAHKQCCDIENNQHRSYRKNSRRKGFHAFFAGPFVIRSAGKKKVDLTTAPHHIDAKGRGSSSESLNFFGFLIPRHLLSSSVFPTETQRITKSTTNTPHTHTPHNANRAPNNTQPKPTTEKRPGGRDKDGPFSQQGSSRKRKVGRRSERSGSEVPAPKAIIFRHVMQCQIMHCDNDNDTLNEDDPTCARHLALRA